MTAASGHFNYLFVEAMWRETHESLACWCLRATRDTEASKDIASEAFTRLCSHWDEVRDPRAFLFVTATNLIRDHWRDRERDKRLARRLELAPHVPLPEPDPDVLRLVHGLPETQRRAVLCYYFADLSVADTARVLELPQGTVKRCLSEARGRLRKCLAA